MSAGEGASHQQGAFALPQSHLTEFTRPHRRRIAHRHLHPLFIGSHRASVKRDAGYLGGAVCLAGRLLRGCLFRQSQRAANPTQPPPTHPHPPSQTQTRPPTGSSAALLALLVRSCERPSLRVHLDESGAHEGGVVLSRSPLPLHIRSHAGACMCAWLCAGSLRQLQAELPDLLFHGVHPELVVLLLLCEFVHHGPHRAQCER
jgi:hypothetical protein